MLIEKIIRALEEYPRLEKTSFISYGNNSSRFSDLDLMVIGEDNSQNCITYLKEKFPESIFDITVIPKYALSARPLFIFPGLQKLSLLLQEEKSRLLYGELPQYVELPEETKKSLPLSRLLYDYYTIRHLEKDLSWYHLRSLFSFYLSYNHYLQRPNEYLPKQKIIEYMEISDKNLPKPFYQIIYRGLNFWRPKQESPLLLVYEKLTSNFIDIVYAYRNQVNKQLPELQYLFLKESENTFLSKEENLYQSYLGNKESSKNFNDRKVFIEQINLIP